MPLDEPKLEIFRVLADGNPLWIATVHGRAEARKRITELIAKTPAQYKVYDSAEARNSLFGVSAYPLQSRGRRRFTMNRRANLP